MPDDAAWRGPLSESWVSILCRLLRCPFLLGYRQGRPRNAPWRVIDRHRSDRGQASTHLCFQPFCTAGPTRPSFVAVDLLSRPSSSVKGSREQAKGRLTDAFLAAHWSPHSPIPFFSSWSHEEQSRERLERSCGRRTLHCATLGLQAGVRNGYRPCPMGETRNGVIV